MPLNDTYQHWIDQNVGKNVTADTRFTLKITSRTAEGLVVADFNFDLVWFILMHVEAADIVKLQVAQALLQDPKMRANFEATIYNPQVKRLIEEYLIFHVSHLEGLSKYIDFSKLDTPIDFISHILFIKRSLEDESREMNLERLKLVKVVLETGFKLPPESQAKDAGAAVQKVLLMDDFNDRFEIANRMLQAGFKLLSNNVVSNTEVMLLILDERANKDCAEILQRHKAEINNLRIQVTDNDKGNIADYYYWVKEDMQVVKFLKDTLAINLSPKT